MGADVLIGRCFGTRLPWRGMGIRYGSMEAEEGQLEHGAASGGAAPPREGQRVVAARAAHGVIKTSILWLPTPCQSERQR